MQLFPAFLVEGGILKGVCVLPGSISRTNSSTLDESMSYLGAIIKESTFTAYKYRSRLDMSVCVDLES